MFWSSLSCQCTLTAKLYLSAQGVVLVDLRCPHVRQQVRSQQRRVRQTLHGGVQVARVPDVHQPTSARQRRLSRRVAPSVQCTASVVGNAVGIAGCSVRPRHVVGAGVPAGSVGGVTGEASDRRWEGAASGLAGGGINCSASDSCRIRRPVLLNQIRRIAYIASGNRTRNPLISSF